MLISYCAVLILKKLTIDLTHFVVFFVVYRALNVIIFYTILCMAAALSFFSR